MTNTSIRVLYVEDDDFQAHVMARVLHKTIENLELMWIRSGEDALAYLQSKPPFDDRAQYPWPDVVLLDLTLSGIGGFDVLESARGCCPDRRIMWAVLSASDSEDDRERAKSLGAEAYFVKGMDNPALFQWLADKAGVQIALTRLSTGWEWHQVSGVAQRVFVREACERLGGEGRASVDPKELERRIWERYTQRDRMDETLGEIVDEVFRGGVGDNSP